MLLLAGGSHSSIARDSENGRGVSFSAPLAVVGIMTAAGDQASTLSRREAAWDAWANLDTNAPHLSGVVKCVFVVGWTKEEAAAERATMATKSDHAATRHAETEDEEEGIPDAAYSEVERRASGDTGPEIAVAGNSAVDASKHARRQSLLPILTVPVLDSYQAVVVKLLHLCRWALKHTSCRFVVKVAAQLG